MGLEVLLPEQSAAADPDGNRLCVLKFGSSVLEREEDYPKVAMEVYRHVRDGEKVVAVVSARAGAARCWGCCATWLFVGGGPDARLS